MARPPHLGEKKRILVVDDYEIVRQGLRALIAAEDDLSVIAEAGTGMEALDEVRRSVPDVVTLDVRLPDVDGVTVCREIKQEFPEIGVVVLTAYADPEARRRAMLAGASAFILKLVGGGEVVEAVRSAADPGRPSVPVDADGRHSRFGPLSPQESQIAHLIATGMTNREIAASMGLAEKTVKNYVSNVLTKLGMARRSEVAAHVASREASDEHLTLAESWEEAGLVAVRGRP